MYEIRPSYPARMGRHASVYGAVVGKRFATQPEAFEFLAKEGWERDPFDTGEWQKDGPTRMCGSIGVSLVHYVRVERVQGR